MGFTFAVKAVTEPVAFNLGSGIINTILGSALDAQELMVPDVKISVNVPPAGKSIPAEQRIKLLHDRNARMGDSADNSLRPEAS